MRSFCNSRLPGKSCSSFAPKDLQVLPCATTTPRTKRRRKGVRRCQRGRLPSRRRESFDPCSNCSCKVVGGGEYVPVNTTPRLNYIYSVPPPPSPRLMLDTIYSVQNSRKHAVKYIHVVKLTQGVSNWLSSSQPFSIAYKPCFMKYLFDTNQRAKSVKLDCTQCSQTNFYTFRNIYKNSTNYWPAIVITLKI